MNELLSTGLSDWLGCDIICLYLHPLPGCTCTTKRLYWNDFCFPKPKQFVYVFSTTFLMSRYFKLSTWSSCLSYFTVWGVGMEVVRVVEWRGGVFVRVHSSV